jgi:hypothetical protein
MEEISSTTNELAYYGTELITTVKIFILSDPYDLLMLPLMLSFV